MSNKEGNFLQSWKRPDELLKLQRLQQRKKKLAARLGQNNNKNNVRSDITEVDEASQLEAKIAQKRKNPFAKSTDDIKKLKIDDVSELYAEDSVLGFMNGNTTCQRAKQAVQSNQPVNQPMGLKPFDLKKFSKLLHDTPGVAARTGDVTDCDNTLEEQKFTKHLPMDWSLKTRVRFFCASELPATTLKTSQMASGLTSFVRCIGTQDSCSSLDISPATRFNQATYYWQHPHLPWLTLFPRNSKENTGVSVGEKERKALAEEWDLSFRGLFQLLRARQCPYFYLCANSFTVLFRAAGTGGLPETHALMYPSTRGMRSALRQEGIEFTMPLKKHADALNRSGNSELSEEVNSALGENVDKNCTINVDEVEEDEWLESLEVDEKEIRKIQTAHSRKLKAKEMSDDFSDSSLLLIEGVESQGFFSFLLNAKSTINNVGRLAGVPPTLLSPVAFPKATMQNLTTRSSKVRMEGIDYYSIEVKGIVLPTFLPYVCQLLSETKDTFSAAMASNNSSLAFSKAAQKLLEEPRPASEEQQNVEQESIAGQVFGQENLSDCGLLPHVVRDMCRTGFYAVSLLERVCYDKNYGYAWS